MKHLLRNITLALVFGGLVAGTTHAWAQNKVTVPAGTRLLIRMTSSVDSSRNRVGSIFTAELQTNLTVDGDVVAPAGTVVHGRLANVTGAGRAVGRSDLQLELTDIIIDGIEVSDRQHRLQRGGRVGREGHGGAHVARGGSWRGHGRVQRQCGAGRGHRRDGGGSRLGDRQGEQVSFPSGTLLEFRLEQPASLPRR